jgi:hypothetical protein
LSRHRKRDCSDRVNLQQNHGNTRHNSTCPACNKTHSAACAQPMHSDFFKRISSVHPSGQDDAFTETVLGSQGNRKILERFASALRSSGMKGTNG